MKKIVIIEDEPSISEMLKLILTREGFETAVFDTGRGAAQFVREQKPNLILLDVMLPGVDGIDIAKEIREIPEMAKTPILVMSALDEAKPLFAGVPYIIGFINKPFVVSNLIETIKKALQ